MTEFRWKKMSPIRRRYTLRLLGRVLILAAAAAVYFVQPDMFDILTGWHFFDGFSLMHLLWGIWMVDMAAQLWPFHQSLSIGSLKLFRQNFRPVMAKINRETVKNYIVSTTKAAFKVVLVWVALIALLGVGYFSGLYDEKVLFLFTVAFYVCDLICVLIWCPFRLIMHNRCCTTCRIFNWDHLMMFSPLIFVDSFYSWSLVLISAVVVLVWECCIFLYPERFWEETNVSLQCAKCTDKLCTQYCRKLRKENA